MYFILVAVGLSIIITSCKQKHTNNQEYYFFDYQAYDKNTYIPIDSVKYLFDRGITVKHFEGADYFINNYKSNSTPINSLEFGPVTIEGNDYYEVNISPVDKINSNEVIVTIDIKLKSYFHHNIYKSEFNPSWVCYSSRQGFINVTQLNKVVICYKNSIKYGDTINLRLYWKTHKDLVELPSIILSVEAINFYGENGEGFREILMFNLNKIK